MSTAYPPPESGRPYQDFTAVVEPVSPVSYYHNTRDREAQDRRASGPVEAIGGLAFALTVTAWAWPLAWPIILSNAARGAGR